MKTGDIVVVADDDDNEVGTSASENPATATLCTEEFFLRTQYMYICSSSPLISAETCGGGHVQTVNATHIDGPG